MTYLQKLSWVVYGFTQWGGGRSRNGGTENKDCLDDKIRANRTYRTQTTAFAV